MKETPMNASTLDLKKTVNLPRTDFPMKANLPQREPQLLVRWAEENLYGQIRSARGAEGPGRQQPAGAPDHARHVGGDDENAGPDHHADDDHGGVE